MSFRQKMLLLVMTLLAGALLFSVPAHASGERSAMQWLEQMQKAAVHQNYRGTFVFSRGSMISTMRIVHRYQDGLEEERLTQLDGQMGEIIRRGNDVMCVLPGDRVVRLEKSNSVNSIVKALSGFMPDHAYYEPRVLGEERVINRKTINVKLAAKDTNRYSYLLWLDKETALLLKSAIRNHKGEDLEHFHYSDIAFPERITDEELAPMTEGKVVSHEMIPDVKRDLRWPSETMWSVDWVPPGFMQVSGEGPTADNSMLFSDGLATFSVFVEMRSDDLMPEGASLTGATVAYAAHLSFDDHHYAVTVVGEIPAMTAMQVAESVKPHMTDKGAESD